MSTTRLSKTDVVADFRRNQILAAARASVTRHGVADTTVDGIARTAGLAKGTVYLYYRSKDEIFAQMLSGDLAELEQHTVPAIAVSAPLDRRLREFFRATLAFFDERRDFIEHCQFEISPEVRRKARQKLGQVFAVQAEAWRRALDQASTIAPMTAGRRTATARAIVSLAHGLTIQRLRGWHVADIRSTADVATALIWQGLARR